MMSISLMDEFAWMKLPIRVFVNLNTDIITIYVVVAAVFVNQSISMWILMIFYLRYFYLVHNTILT
jgi:hypothetical protein